VGDRKKDVNIGGILKESLILYKKGFPLYMALGAAVYAPFFFFFVDQFSRLAMDPEGFMGPRFWTGYALSMAYLILAGTFMGYGATRRACLDYRGESLSTGEILREGVHNFLPLLWVCFIFFWGVMGGYLLLFAPGIILILGWSLFLPVFTEEGLRGRAALERSFALTRGYKSEIFGVFFFLVLILYAVLIVIMILFLVIYWKRMMLWFDGGSGVLPRRFWNGYGLITGGLSVLILPFYYTVPAALYHGLTGKNEEDSPRPNILPGL